MSLAKVFCNHTQVGLELNALDGMIPVADWVANSVIRLVFY